MPLLRHCRTSLTRRPPPFPTRRSSDLPAIEAARGKEPVQQAGARTAAATVPSGGTERIIGTKRLYADGKFNTKDGKAVFIDRKSTRLNSSHPVNSYADHCLKKKTRHAH